jgi:S1-C subfamily serine protease
MPRLRAFVLIAVLTASSGLSCGGDDGEPGAQDEAAATAPAATAAGGQGGGSAGSVLDITGVVNRVKPAVVQITSQQVSVDQFNAPFTVPAGVGSGFLYDGDGHILTNNHVVEGATSLTVSLPDGRTFDAELVGGDARTDLAVLKIDGGDLPVAALGESSTLEVGQWVVAIGNALGLAGGPTVTVGVVSALDRTVQEPARDGGPGPVLFDLVQTSAAINPGNSGGPLVDLQGRVIGINTLVAGEAAPGVPAQGIGFAIAVDTAKPIADELVSSGDVDHPYLGIRYVPLNAAIAASAGLQQRTGALVLGVEPGSPAAGRLQENDVIVSVDGEELQGQSDLAEVLSQRDPGDTVDMRIVRSGSEQTVEVTLGEAPD